MTYSEAVREMMAVYGDATTVSDGATDWMLINLLEAAEQGEAEMDAEDTPDDYEYDGERITRNGSIEVRLVACTVCGATGHMYGDTHKCAACAD